MGWYMVHGYVRYMVKKSIEADSPEEAKRKFEEDYALSEVTITDGEGFVAVDVDEQA